MILVIGSCVHLPLKSPDDIEIIYRIPGGMFPLTKSIVISKESGLYSIVFKGNERKISYSLTDDEFEKLYNEILKKHKNDEIAKIVQEKLDNLIK